MIAVLRGVVTSGLSMTRDEETCTDRDPRRGHGLLLSRGETQQETQEGCADPLCTRREGLNLLTFNRRSTSPVQVTRKSQSQTLPVRERVTSVQCPVGPTQGCGT